MDILNQVIIPYFLPIAQSAIFECSKYLFCKAVKPSEEYQFKKVVKESVDAITEIELQTKESLAQTIYQCCKSVEKTDISTIVLREFKQSGIDSADPLKVAAHIYVNIIKGIERIPELRDKISYEQIFQIRSIMEKMLKKSDSNYQAIKGELDNISNNINLMSQSVLLILDLLARAIIEDSNRHENALYIPDAYKDYFFNHLFLEKDRPDGQIARLKDVYIPNSFKLLDFSVSNEGTVYPDIMDFIHNFIYDNLRSVNYHLRYSFPPNYIKVLFIKGLPGSGKSSFFYYLAHLKAHDSKFYPDHQFFFIKLIEVYNAMNGKISTVTPLHDVLTYLGNPSYSNKKRVVVLDGLDEICVAKDLDIRTYCENLIRSAVREDIKIIITTRLNYIDIPHSTNKNVINIQLINLTPNQLSLWCEKYFAVHSTLHEEHNSAVKNINYMIKNKDELLIDIFAVPLLFYMIVVSRIDISMIKSIGELYDSVFAELQSRNYDESNDDFIQKPRISKRIPIQLARRIAMEISYKMYEKNTTLLNIDSSELQNAISNATSISHRFQEKDKNDIESLFPMTFFYKDKRDAVEFAHKSILEFFAAEKIYQEALVFRDDFDSFIKLYIVNPIVITNEVLSFFTYYVHKDSVHSFKSIFPKLIEDFKCMINEKVSFENNNITYNFETSLVVFKIYWYFMRCITKEKSSEINALINEDSIKRYIISTLSIRTSNSVPFLDNAVIPYDFSSLKFKGYSFEYARLNYCVFDSSELTDCKYYYTDLSYASLQHLIVVDEFTLESCNLSGTKINYEKKKNRRRGEEFSNTVSFIGCNFNNATIHDTDIATSRFEFIISMTNARLKNVVMTYAQLLYFLQFPVVLENVTVDLREEDGKLKRNLIGLSEQEQKTQLINRISKNDRIHASHNLNQISQQIDFVNL